ncbi:MAG: hypothetical protein A2Z91_05710 [Deltaproteobacteria bacterium GWA2_38_16]|nr:MAG: hypothetical protein A2Z91_05710 [Deltaproteobacteria bacterium GWA2_38_16]OGQ02608.1 MAG: hypothetical protein A3D19_05005 [Deltaproteobacteria bacterium RIFCSPHIGHO2_02_FULL_38_15]OGQ33793.1 MAG: hypothetical protein A3A72_03240 [Deltaproteobacteria bacterium RIFCSPLOWO2_01_FULL_38_9]OGQ59708.1 MAG: hypothetical protein A3G92_05555 [Deltaproteobacteria bacterium RIFCSPLOWO2_12_FULL_38_8]HBQ20307.1 hypothetical protein [Deltaproteobacteria bacterium]
MNEKKIIFVSDLHLKGIRDPRMKAFLSFLEQEKTSLSRLVIGGDLFDFWMGFNAVVFYEYVPVLNKLLELKEVGVKIDYIEGNHDFSLGPFFTEALKVNVIKEESMFQLGDFKIYMAHGDEVNRKDYGYLFLRWFLRACFTKALVKFLPPSWIWKLSQRSSHVSRNYRSANPKAIQLFRDFARQKLETENMDVVILGHTHHPDQQEFMVQGKKKFYFNTGDWISHFTYLEYDQGIFSLKKFIF